MAALKLMAYPMSCCSFHSWAVGGRGEGRKGEEEEENFRHCLIRNRGLHLWFEVSRILILHVLATACLHAHGCECRYGNRTLVSGEFSRANVEYSWLSVASAYASVYGLSHPTATTAQLR